MRNSNCLAIAPTATIANIVGVSASIEPTYQNLFVKSNLSGEFTVVNDYLVARPEARRPVGRGDDRRPQVLRRQPRAHRPRAGRPAPALCHRVRGRAEVAGRVRGAAPEMDRPVAVAQHLHGRRLGQEARRDLQARLDPRPEDHLLPARAGRDARREVDEQGGRAQRGFDGKRRAAPRCARSTSPTARHASDHPRQPQLRRAVHGTAVVGAEGRRACTP